MSFCRNKVKQKFSSMHPLIYCISHLVHTNHLERRGELYEFILFSFITFMVKHNDLKEIGGR